MTIPSRIPPTEMEVLTSIKYKMEKDYNLAYNFLKTYDQSSDKINKLLQHILNLSEHKTIQITAKTAYGNSLKKSIENKQKDIITLLGRLILLRDTQIKATENTSILDTKEGLALELLNEIHGSLSPKSPKESPRSVVSENPSHFSDVCLTPETESDQEWDLCKEHAKLKNSDDWVEVKL